MKIENELGKLKEQDIYSIVLFSLCQLIDVPEYSVISELPFVLDRENMLRLCEYFGGMTIRIPTTSELERLIYALLLYQKVNLEGMNIDEVMKELKSGNSSLPSDIRSEYRTICDVLNTYSFDLNKDHVRTVKEDQ